MKTTTAGWLVATFVLFFFAVGCGDRVPSSQQNGDDEATNSQNQSQNDSTNQAEVCGDVDCSDDRHCDPETGDCVECVEADHCPDQQVCDGQTNQCVVCAGDDDCPDQQVCDTAEPVCVECIDSGDCPDGLCDVENGVCRQFVDREVPTDGLDGVNDERFDFDLGPDATPVVAMLDGADATVRVATLEGGDWSSREALDLSDHDVDAQTPIRMIVDPEGDPHVAVAAGTEFIYGYREDGSWDYEVLDTIETGTYRSVAVALGDDGAIHKIGGKTEASSGAFYYRRLGPEGDTVTQRHELLYTDDTVEGIDIAMRSDDQPLLMMTVTDDESQILVPDDVVDTTWDGGGIGVGTDDFTALAMDGKDNPWVAVRPRGADSVEVRRFAGDTAGDDWADWNVETTSPSAASRPWFTFDETGAPHLSYALATGEGYALTYGRRSGESWQHHRIVELDSSTASRITVEARIPHVVARDDEGGLRYFVLQ